MSNKHIGTARKKWDGEAIKTTNSGIFKDGHKMQGPFSPKNFTKDSPKNFKNYIRHASEEEFKRFTQSSRPPVDHQSKLNAED